MPHLLKIPVKIEVTIQGIKYTTFEINPLITGTDAGKEVVGWKAALKGRPTQPLYDILAQSVLTKPVTDRVCVLTFEREDCPEIPVRFEFPENGESWNLNMRAVEREDEYVFYQIEIDGEWLDLLDTYLGDLIPDEVLPFAENIVFSTMSFGDADAVYEQMS